MFKSMKIYAALAMCVLMPNVAHALQYDIGKFSAKLTGYATGGVINPDFETPLGIGDWRGRAQFT